MPLQSTDWKCDPVPAFVGATRSNPGPHYDSWPGSSLLTLDPSANRLPINLAEYVSLLPRKEDGNLYTNQIRTTEV
jgi:hypothetical protein